MNVATKNMRNVLGGVAAFVAMLSVVSTAAPAMAQGNNRQRDKNNMRNLGTGLGAVAAEELLRGKGTHALILGAGAAYAGKKYEDARKAQSRENRITRRYRYRNGRRIGYYNIRNGQRLSYHSLRG